MRYLPITIILIFATLGIFQSCKTQKTAQADLFQTYRAAFYNVENLFDTIDHPVKLDDDFTPAGRQEWNTERYYYKLNQLAKVVSGMDFPALLGLCEVENPVVLKDFIEATDLKSHGYDFVHYESPDMRGIDVALLYKKSVLKVNQSKYIRIPFPPAIALDYTSRDILYVEGMIGGSVPVHIFINHWPSRRGGSKESEPKRTHVASYLRSEVDNIFSKNPNANILIMGDLNDEPYNNSVANTLNAQALELSSKEKTLYNCMVNLDNQKKGTYNFRGDWNMLDHIIISSSMCRQDASLYAQDASIYRQPWMMFNDKKYGETPNRTYGGPNYYGGFSDHLPVYIDLLVRTKK